MSIARDVDPEALSLFSRADLVWQEWPKGFIETRQLDRETTDEYQSREKNFISYEELRDRGLIGASSAAIRDAGIVWLRNKLGIDG